MRPNVFTRAPTSLLRCLSHISVGAHDLSPIFWLLLVLWIPWRKLRVPQRKSVRHAFTMRSPQPNNDHWVAGLGTAGGGCFVLKLFRMGSDHFPGLWPPDALCNVSQPSARLGNIIGQFSRSLDHSTAHIESSGSKGTIGDARYPPSDPPFRTRPRTRGVRCAACDRHDYRWSAHSRPSKVCVRLTYCAQFLPFHSAVNTPV